MFQRLAGLHHARALFLDVILARMSLAHVRSARQARAARQGIGWFGFGADSFRQLQGGCRQT
ncbi:hypothetical protein D9M68_707060 [compost metagenome]